MIEGVPSYVWTREMAAELLGSSCLVDSLAPETANREDMSLFKLRAWCFDPDDVPVDKRIWVPEPEGPVDPAARQPTSIQLLEYKMLIHIGRVREHAGPENWLRPSSSDGSGQSGLPEDSGGFDGRGEWRVLPWTRGVRDHRGSTPGGGTQGGSYRQALLGRIGPSSWRLPPMVDGAATVDQGSQAPVAGTMPAPAVDAGPPVATGALAAVRDPVVQFATDDPPPARGAE